MLNRDYIGHTLPAATVTVEAGQLRLFNKAIGETRDVYFDEAAAVAAGYRSMLAPPTFGTPLSMLAIAIEPVLETIGVDYRYLLHGEESFEYLAPICAGDEITIRETITDIYDRKNGTMEFAEFDAAFTNQFGDTVLKRRRVLIQRYPVEPQVGSA